MINTLAKIMGGINLAYITCLEEEFLEHNSNGGGNP